MWCPETNTQTRIEMEIVEDVVIVGAGIAGLATAVALKRVGVKALVLEKSQELRTTGAALTLLPNAWRALDALGVSHKLTCLYAPILKGSVTNVATGAIQEISLPAGTNGEGNVQGPRPVHRKKLLEALAQELSVDSIRFSSKLAAIETHEEGGSSVHNVHLEDGTIIKSKVLIGCDGVHSVVAKWLGLAAPVHSGRWGALGLALLPEGHGFKQQVQQFVDLGLRAGFGSLNDRELYWFLLCKSPLQGERTKNPELIQRGVRENYAKKLPSTFLDVVQHADLSSLSWAPLMLRYPWNIIFGNLKKGNVTVVGDAMHPMTPDLAQGGSAALEDAVVLGRHIGNSFRKHGRLVSGDLSLAIDGYVKERKWRVAALVAGSYLSGWVQQDGSSWWMKFLRDSIFYKYLLVVLSRVIDYDIGKLPIASNGELKDPSTKKDEIMKCE